MHDRLSFRSRQLALGRVAALFSRSWSHPPSPALADDAAMYALRATLVSDGVSDLSSRDELGTAVSTDGFVAVVGAPMHDLAGEDAGAVYVYRLEGGGWVEEGRLTAADPGADDDFGAAVALTGNVIVVGAPRASGNGGSRNGAVYVFEYDGAAWRETHRITAQDGVDGDGFGTAVALDGGRLVVGAPRADSGGTPDSGAAYVFEHAGTSWLYQATLVPTSPVASGRFGSAVASAADTIAIGTPRANAAAPAAGSVTVFVNSGGWVEEQEVAGADTASGDAFGSSISVLGNVLAVGAPESGGSGAAYVFEREGRRLERARATDSGSCFSRRLHRTLCGAA